MVDFRNCEPKASHSQPSRSRERDSSHGERRIGIPFSVLARSRNKTLEKNHEVLCFPCYIVVWSVFWKLQWIQPRLPFLEDEIDTMCGVFLKGREACNGVMNAISDRKMFPQFLRPSACVCTLSQSKCLANALTGKHIPYWSCSIFWDNITTCSSWVKYDKVTDTTIFLNLMQLYTCLPILLSCLPSFLPQFYSLTFTKAEECMQVNNDYKNYNGWWSSQRYVGQKRRPSQLDDRWSQT